MRLQRRHAFGTWGFGDRKGVRARPRRGETVHDQPGIGTLPDAARRCPERLQRFIPTVGESREAITNKEFDSL